MSRVRLALRSGRLDSACIMEIDPLPVDGTTIEALDAVVTWTRKDID